MLNLRLSQRNESYHKKLMPSVSAIMDMLLILFLIQKKEEQ